MYLIKRFILFLLFLFSFSFSVNASDNSYISRLYSTNLTGSLFVTNTGSFLIDNINCYTSTVSYTGSTVYQLSVYNNFSNTPIFTKIWYYNKDFDFNFNNLNYSFNSSTWILVKLFNRTNADILWFNCSMTYHKYYNTDLTIFNIYNILFIFYIFFYCIFVYFIFRYLYNKFIKV